MENRTINLTGFGRILKRGKHQQYSPQSTGNQKTKGNKRDIKLKNTCAAQGAVIRVKRQPRKGRKISRPPV